MSSRDNSEDEMDKVFGIDYSESLESIGIYDKLQRIRIQELESSSQESISNILFNVKTIGNTGKIDKNYQQRIPAAKNNPLLNIFSELSIDSIKTPERMFNSTVILPEKRWNSTVIPPEKSCNSTVIDNVTALKKHKRTSSELVVKTRARKKKNAEENTIDPATCFKSLGDKTFNLLIADPPWKYKRQVGSGVAKNHYDCLSHEELMKMPVPRIIKTDCYLFMWTTHPMTAKVPELMAAWGFRYVTAAFVWIKTTKKGEPRMGLGSHLRSCSEMCYLGVCGHPLTLRQSKKVITYMQTDSTGEIDHAFGHVENIIDEIQNDWIDTVENVITNFKKKCKGKYPKLRENWKSFSDDVRNLSTDLKLAFMERLRKTYPDIIIATPKKHSEKPMHLVIEKLKQYFGSNYDTMDKLEMFARTSRPGWSAFGDQVGLLNVNPVEVDKKAKKIHPNEAKFGTYLDQLPFNCTQVDKKVKKMLVAEI